MYSFIYHFDVFIGEIWIGLKLLYLVGVLFVTICICNKNTSLQTCFCLILGNLFFSDNSQGPRDKNWSRANCVLIYSDLYQNLQWSLTFNLKVVTYLKSASEASYDVINMATIIRKCP